MNILIYQSYEYSPDTSLFMIDTNKFLLSDPLQKKAHDYFVNLGTDPCVYLDSDTYDNFLCYPVEMDIIGNIVDAYYQIVIT